MKGLVSDRGYLKIRIWPWGRMNKPYIEAFGLDTPDNRKIAEYKLREYRNKISIGKFDIGPVERPMLFKEAAANIEKDEPTLKYDYVSLVPFFGEYFLHDISPILVAAWRKKYGKIVKFTTVNRRQAVLASTFEKIRQRNAESGTLGDKIKLPKENPCQFVVKPTERHEARQRVLSVEEWDRLAPILAKRVVFFKNTGKVLFEAGWLLDHCKMGIYSTLRLKDISSLSGRNIDVDVLEGIQAKNARIHQKYYVPLSESLRAIAKRIASRPFATGWIVQKYFREACVEANIQDCTFRDLRRTSVTWMRKLGVDPTVRRDRAGHASRQTTEAYEATDYTEQLAGIQLLEGRFK